MGKSSAEADERQGACRADGHGNGEAYQKQSKPIQALDRLPVLSLPWLRSVARHRQLQQLQPRRDLRGLTPPARYQKYLAASGVLFLGN